MRLRPAVLPVKTVLVRVIWVSGLFWANSAEESFAQLFTKEQEVRLTSEFSCMMRVPL